MALNFLGNITNITNITGHIHLPALPSLAYFVLILIFLFFIIRISVKIAETISQYVLPIMIFGTMFLLEPIYLQILKGKISGVAYYALQSIKINPLAFYDTLLYIFVQNKFPLHEQLVPFLLLYAFMLYIIYLLYRKGHELVAPLFALLLLFILTLGGQGLIIALLDNIVILIIFVLTIILYYTFILLKYLFTQ